MKTILSGAAVLFLMAGCITYTPPKVMQAYDGPPRPRSEIAHIKLFDTHANPSNLLEKLWGAGVTSVDGAVMTGFSHADVLPGKHRLKMFCWTRNPNVKNAQEVEVEFNVEAGKTYYPWANVVATVIRGSGAAGAIPGTVVGSLAAGFCQPFIADHMADVVR